MTVSIGIRACKVGAKDGHRAAPLPCDERDVPGTSHFFFSANPTRLETLGEKKEIYGILAQYSELLVHRRCDAL